MMILRKWLCVLMLVCAPLAVQAAGPAEDPVDINAADSETLVDRLVGVGPHKAMAIVQHRQQHGPFKQVDDLADVKGIGRKLVEQNRSRLTVVPANAKLKPK